MQKRHPEIDLILTYLSDEDKALFLNELLHAIDQSISEGNFGAINSCVENWEDTAELLSIPGFKDCAWAQFNKLKKLGCIS